MNGSSLLHSGVFKFKVLKTTVLYTLCVFEFIAWRKIIILPAKLSLLRVFLPSVANPFFLSLRKREREMHKKRKKKADQLTWGQNLPSSSLAVRKRRRTFASPESRVSASTTSEENKESKRGRERRRGKQPSPLCARDPHIPRGEIKEKDERNEREGDRRTERGGG